MGITVSEIVGRIDRLDQNVIAAPFLYASDTQELDIECSTWGVEEAPQTLNIQYVVQPNKVPGEEHRFRFDLASDHSTHCIDWESTGVHFLSFQGSGTKPKSPASVIGDWNYSGFRNPALSALLRVHINVWLMNGAPPTDGKEGRNLHQGDGPPSVLSASPPSSERPLISKRRQRMKLP